MGLLLSCTHGENNSPQTAFNTDWLWYSAFQQNYKHSNLPILIESLLGSNSEKCRGLETATQDSWNGDQHTWMGWHSDSFQEKLKYTNQYSQLSPCGHPPITDTPIIRTAAKSRAKINCRGLTETDWPTITDSGQWGHWLEVPNSARP